MKECNKAKLPVILNFINDEIKPISRRYATSKRYNSEKMICFSFYKPISQLRYIFEDER